jgi:sugar lactone lactonase YvrE
MARGVEITRVGQVRCTVGEGPVWDVAEQALYFVDLLGRRLWRYDAGAGDISGWDMPGMIGSLALRERSGVLVALEDGFHTVDLASGAATPFARPADLTQDAQFNDGKADPRGRFVAATQARSLQEPRPLGSLYSLAPDGTIAVLDGPIHIPNGPCWSPDGTTFYFSDSIPRTVFAYDYDLATGAVANRRIFADTSTLGGIPDGATVDDQGRYWVAICLGGKIACYGADGVLQRTIDMPVKMPGSIMFGGPDLDRLYVTSLDAGALGQPASEDDGGLFVIDGLGATGRPEPRFKG